MEAELFGCHLDQFHCEPVKNLPVYTQNSTYRKIH